MKKSLDVKIAEMKERAQINQELRLHQSGMQTRILSQKRRTWAKEAEKAFVLDILDREKYRSERFRTQRL